MNRRARISRVQRVTAMLALLLLACPLLTWFDAADEQTTTRAELLPILKRLDRVAELYKDRALSFTCDERIEFDRGTGSHTYRYVFVYTDEGQLVDHRLSRSGKRVVAKEKSKAVLLNAYMWIFLFQKDRWRHYAYELEADEEVLGRPARTVRFVAQAPIYEDINDWSGRIWIDAESFQPLRVEAFRPEDDAKHEEMIAAYRRAEQEGRSHRSTHSFQRITTDFGETKNGMRFPSIVYISSEQVRVFGGRKRARLKQDFVSLIRQEYSNYQFYEVKTEQEIEEFVRSAEEREGS